MIENIKKNVPLVFVHIPKCGGQSLNEILRANYQKFIRIDKGKTIREIREGKIDLNKFEYISGHIRYKHLNLVDDQANYITLVREPFFQFTSFYKYIRRMDSHRFHDVAINSTLEELYDYLIKIGHEMASNVQCINISGNDGASFEDAKKTLNSNYSLYAPIDFFPEFLEKGKKLFNWDIPEELPHKNKSPKKQDIVLEDRALMFKIYSSKMDDLKLYNYIKERFIELYLGN